MTRVAVTGAAGFVGRHLLPLLAEQDDEVRALARPGPPGASLPGNVDLMRGDVRNRETVRALVAGSDLVVHLAASFDPGDDVAGIIIEGTRQVVQVALEARVRRLIFLSCLGADAAAHSPFYAAKWQAECEIRSSELPFVILRPSLILGPDDGVLRPLAHLIRSWPVVPVPGSGTERTQPVSVDDVARCIMLALSRGDVANELVAVGGSVFVTLRELVDLVAGRLGQVRPKVLVPESFMPAVTALLPAPVRHLYLQPRVAQFRQGVVASPGIVNRVFGFTPQPVLEHLGEYLA